MQYGSVDSIEAAGSHGRPGWLRHLPAALTATLAVYGLGTHHAVLVAAGLAAVLAFQNRLVGARQPRPGTIQGATHADGGSFKGITPAGSAAERSPRVVDGGIERAHDWTYRLAGRSGVR